jgi:hypothetical protein
VKKLPGKPVRFRIAACTNQNRTVNPVLFLHTLLRGDDSGDEERALT